MDTPLQPTAKTSRRKWFIAGGVGFTLAGVIVFLCAPWKPFDLVTAEHLGGNLFSLANHTDDSIWVEFLEIQAQTNAQWRTISSQQTPLALLPRETKQIPIGLDIDSMPSRPWRLRAAASKPLHGLPSLLRRARIYWQIHHPPSSSLDVPNIKPFDPKVTVFSSTADFVAYPMSVPEMSDIHPFRSEDCRGDIAVFQSEQQDEIVSRIHCSRSSARLMNCR